MDEYNPKLLNFLYELTKLDRFMSHREIAKTIRIGNKKISPKTVERWFDELHRPLNHPSSLSKDRFDYFPRFSFERLGLIYMYVIVEDPHESLVSKFKFTKYSNYSLWLYDFKKQKSVLLLGYPLPFVYLANFKDAWKKAKSKKLVKSYTIHETYSSYMLYSPWHKVVDEQGIFHPERNNDEEINEQIRKFKRYYDTLPEHAIDDAVFRNPFIIPTLFEQHLKSRSSNSIWKSAKKALGQQVWDYIPKSKKKTNGTGIRKVQEAIKEIHDCKLFHQMKLVYLPLQLDNFFIYCDIQFKDVNELTQTVKQIAKYSLQITILPKKDNEVFLISLTNHKGLPHLIESFEKVGPINLSIPQHEKSLRLLTDDRVTSFNYANLFNPKKIKWK